MLWVKVFHIVFVTSWFAGLFYLPRIFVNMAQQKDPAVQAVLAGMARRLFAFTCILGVPAAGLGLLLVVYYRIGMGPGNGWILAKLLLVSLLVGYQRACGVMLRKFERGANQRSHIFYRWFNEVPVLMLVAVTALVVLKPF